MRLSEWFSIRAPCKRFDTHELLFLGLQNLDNEAILCLQVRAQPMVEKTINGYGLPKEQAEEIINSATMVFLQKIQNGAYRFEGHAPMTYFIEIVKRQALMATRSLKKATLPLDKLPEVVDPDVDLTMRKKEAADTVRLLLDQLGQPCKDVVQLHHIDGFSDEEVVARKLTAYSTTASLKVKRSDCMKKLIEIATKWQR